MRAQWEAVGGGGRWKKAGGATMARHQPAAFTATRVFPPTLNTFQALVGLSSARSPPNIFFVCSFPPNMLFLCFLWPLLFSPSTSSGAPMRV